MDANEAEAAEARQLARELAASYRLQRDSADELVMINEPAMRWTNQLNRRFYGDVYVWTWQGRPEVVASITHVYGARRARETEIQSLSAERPRLLLDGEPVWTPSQPGVRLQPLPDATAPASTPAGRLRQMRRLASQFSVTGQYGDEREELRLLRTPVYRYEKDDSQWLDGALFALAKGTDPDAFLLLEARVVNGRSDAASRPRYEWSFALARFTGNALRAQYGGEEVWRAERLETRRIRDPRQPYFSLRK